MSTPLCRNDILHWLCEDDPVRLEELWRAADECRRQHVGDSVHLRGLIEISNYCIRQCAYCGIRAANCSITRYRMSQQEILECARQAMPLGYGTVVLQAGEDPALTKEWVAELIRRIKQETGLAVTLSLGERSPVELTAWREAGADRYLLRIETSNSALFRRIHPPRQGAGATTLSRVDQLALMRQLGYEIGSGSLIGIPGQSWHDLADDLMRYAQLDLDMIGVGPFIPHPETPLGSLPESIDPQGQVPNSEEVTYRVMALARILCPQANIPSTTALATVNPNSGRELGLRRGANVIMPNLTPAAYRQLYEIYPSKACLSESAEQSRGWVRDRIGRASCRERV